MKYFNGITDLELAKQHYRTLAKQLHPDAGGTVLEFQKMQHEYNALLLRLQQNHNAITPPQQPSSENELISELGRLAKVLIKKQVPQDYLKQKMQTTESPLKKGFFSDLVDLLDSIR